MKEIQRLARSGSAAHYSFGCFTDVAVGFDSRVLRIVECMQDVAVRKRRERKSEPASVVTAKADFASNVER